MTNTMQEVFKDRFRELVGSTGLSKTECAKQIGISYTTFNDIYEYGQGKRMRILIRIANYFDVSSDYLLGLTDDKTRKGSRKSRGAVERMRN